MKKQKILLAIITLLLAGTYTPLRAQATVRGDSVQTILRQLAELQEDFEIVQFLPTTQRYHLVLAHDEVPENLLMSIQDAFLYDVESYCQYYGWKYLIDWRLLASKAARESFWGTSYLSNKSMNFFGIRANKKEWICENFQFCEGVVKNDPEPATFVVFPSFKASLWMFIHTIYNKHYLQRLPDQGQKVEAAIAFEKTNRTNYWQRTDHDTAFASQLSGSSYTTDEVIYTWSEHAFNNLCINCSRDTDRRWVEKIDRAILRRAQAPD
ncbi:MAG: glucosaminidase domain-containing protein [Bacteroidota bacterium]